MRLTGISFLGIVASFLLALPNDLVAGYKDAKAGDQRLVAPANPSSLSSGKVVTGAVQIQRLISGRPVMVYQFDNKTATQGTTIKNLSPVSVEMTFGKVSYLDWIRLKLLRSVIPCNLFDFDRFETDWLRFLESFDGEVFNAPAGSTPRTVRLIFRQLSFDPEMKLYISDLTELISIQVDNRMIRTESFRSIDEMNQFSSAVFPLWRHKFPNARITIGDSLSDLFAMNVQERYPHFSHADFDDRLPESTKALKVTTYLSACRERNFKLLQRIFGVLNQNTSSLKDEFGAKYTAAFCESQTTGNRVSLNDLEKEDKWVLPFRTTEEPARYRIEVQFSAADVKSFKSKLVEDGVWNTPFEKTWLDALSEEKQDKRNFGNLLYLRPIRRLCLADSCVDVAEDDHELLRKAVWEALQGTRLYRLDWDREEDQRSAHEASLSESEPDEPLQKAGERALSSALSERSVKDSLESEFQSIDSALQQEETDVSSKGLESSTTPSLSDIKAKLTDVVSSATPVANNIKAKLTDVVSSATPVANDIKAKLTDVVSSTPSLRTVARHIADKVLPSSESSTSEDIDSSTLTGEEGPQTESTN